MNGFLIGDRVVFVLDRDIEAVVIGALIRAKECQYEIAWMYAGERRTDWVRSYEIKLVQNKTRESINQFD